MSVAPENSAAGPRACPDDLPIIVIGAGPVGIRTVQALLRRAPNTRVRMYGEGPWTPYNRVRLSSLVAG